MNTDMLSSIDKLSDRDLLAKVVHLAQCEREATVALVAHLAELEERELYLGEGCSSLFTYCTRVLHFSESAAYRRVEATRMARKYPIILEYLSDGSINLTTVRLLAPELTPDNHRTLLAKVRNKSTRRVAELIVHLRPKALVPSTVRKLPATPAETGQPSLVITAETPQAVPPLLPLAERPQARPVVIPLAPERYKVQFTATKEGYENLRVAQDLLRHQIPNGDVGKILELALARLVRDLKKEKLGATERPRANGRTESDSRHIPAAVKRKVWARDGGQCAFVAQNGRRCDERGFLQFHHVEPYSTGGKAAVDNIQLRCRAHNGYEAELYFGRTMAKG